MSKLTTKFREEIEKLLPPTIYFFVALHLVAIFRVLMLKGTGIALGTSATITVAALILGKAVLIADLFPFINRFPDKPLANNIAWKTAIYMLITMLLHYLERLVDFWREAGGFVAGNQRLLAEIVWPHFWAIQILLVLLILMYCTIREVIRVIGVDKVRTMFFGPPQKTRGSQQSAPARAPPFELPAGGIGQACRTGKAFSVLYLLIADSGASLVFYR